MSKYPYKNMLKLIKLYLLKGNDTYSNNDFNGNRNSEFNFITIKYQKNWVHHLETYFFIERVKTPAQVK